MLLLRAREAVLEPTKPILRRHGLTEPQWRVLRTVGVEGEMETTRIAHIVFLHPPSVTRIVRDLAGLGYVTRKADPHDGRVVVVAISDAGRAILEEALPQIRDIARRLRIAYRPEELQVLEQHLIKLIETAGGLTA
jgi:homoprotocatechuate degradation regulator HpaR